MDEIPGALVYCWSSETERRRRRHGAFVCFSPFFFYSHLGFDFTPKPNKAQFGIDSQPAFEPKSAFGATFTKHHICPQADFGGSEFSEKLVSEKQQFAALPIAFAEPLRKNTEIDRFSCSFLYPHRHKLGERRSTSPPSVSEKHHQKYERSFGKSLCLKL